MVEGKYNADGKYEAIPGEEITIENDNHERIETVCVETPHKFKCAACEYKVAPYYVCDYFVCCSFEREDEKNVLFVKKENIDAVEEILTAAENRIKAIKEKNRGEDQDA